MPPRRLVATAGVALLALGAGAVAYRVASSRVSASAASSQVFCTLAGASVLAASDLPGFTLIVNESPPGPLVPGGLPAAIQKLSIGLRGNHLVGFLSNAALNGPDRASEGTGVPATGQVIKDLPAVPLSGQIVRDSAGLLEVYETLTAYATSSEAQAWADDVMQSLSFGGSKVQVPGLAGTVFFLPAPTTGPHPPYEESYQLVAVLGNTVMHLSVQGGVGLKSTDLVTVNQLARSQIQRACPTLANHS